MNKKQSNPPPPRGSKPPPPPPPPPLPRGSEPKPPPEPEPVPDKKHNLTRDRESHDKLFKMAKSASHLGEASADIAYALVQLDTQSFTRLHRIESAIYQIEKAEKLLREAQKWAHEIYKKDLNGD